MALTGPDLVIATGAAVGLVGAVGLHVPYLDARVAVALVIGTIELLAVFADRLSLTGGVWDVVSNLDLNLVGYVIVGLFVATWALALSVWHFGRVEERWTASLEREAPR